MVELNNAFSVATAITITLSLVSGAPSKNSDLLKIAHKPVKDLLNSIFVSEYSFIIINYGSSSSETLQEYASTSIPLGSGYFEVPSRPTNVSLLNESQFASSMVIANASKLSRSSGMGVVLVASEDLLLLESFAVESLQKRLLTWDTRLIVITTVDQVQINHLVTSYWIFSMMDTIFLRVHEVDHMQLRYTFFCYLPYSNVGSKLVTIGSWTKENGISISSVAGFFPDKFLNFHGSVVNVTALPFPPYWIETKSLGNDSKVIYSGTDYYLLDAVAKALNFSIYVIPTSNWPEVTRKVELRESFMATVIHSTLAERLERYDFSSVYEYGGVDFSFSKPQIQPQWQSLYFPLSSEVWVSTLVSLFCMSCVFYCINYLQCQWSGDIGMNPATCLQEFLGLLLSQNLPRRTVRGHSSRAIIAIWIIFSLVIATAYRGNLVAYLTLPKYPLRPESIEELVQVADRITMPPYGAEFKEFFGNSNSEVFKTLSSLMHIVPSLYEGQKQATENKHGHLDTRRYQELSIAKQFTNVDGTTDLYIGRESIMPGQAAWPIPHDAPYREVLDWCIMAVLEAGLYEKWSQDLMRKTRSETRKRLLLERLADISNQTDASYNTEADIIQDNSDKSSSIIMALTIIHMQGPLFLLSFGLIMASMVFMTEMCIKVVLK